MNECMLDRQTAGCVVEKIVLPQIVSIKQASEIMKLPPYYLRRVCRENPDIAFQSGVKWYINLGKILFCKFKEKEGTANVNFKTAGNFCCATIC